MGTKPLPYTYVCQHCGQEYHPKSIERNKFCSTKCMGLHKAKPKPVKTIKYRQCAVCGTEFKQLRNKVVCSPACRVEYHRRTSFIRDVKPRECRWCGDIFTPERKSHFKATCCEDHHRLLIRDRNKLQKRNYKSEAKREERRRYRARKVNAYVAPVSGKQLFIRDKGRCQICGRRVDPKLAYPDPMSMSIDHIIPLSRGGTHEPKNVQLTHWICNCNKRDGVIERGEQLRLC